MGFKKNGKHGGDFHLDRDEEIFINNNFKPESGEVFSDAQVESGASELQAVTVTEDADERTFLSSLDSFSSKSLPKKKKGKKKKKKLGKDGIIRLCVMCLCIGVFVYAVYNILSYKIEEWINESVNEDFKNQMYGDNEPKSFIGKQKSSRIVSPTQDLLAYLGSDQAGTSFIEPDKLDYYENLRNNLSSITEMHPNTYGWITVSGTQIDYPIMKGKDNDYYLTHNEKGEESAAGAIFADYRLSSDYSSNRNVVIYGHDMTSGAMFRGIKQFFDSEDKYSKAQVMEITVITLDGVYIYEFFSGYRDESGYFIKTSFSSNSSYLSFLQRIRSNNKITKKASYDESSKIITLVTCTNVPGKPNERYALHGILKEFIKFDD